MPLLREAGRNEDRLSALPSRVDRLPGLRAVYAVEKRPCGGDQTVEQEGEKCLS